MQIVFDHKGSEEFYAERRYENEILSYLRENVPGVKIIA